MRFGFGVIGILIAGYYVVMCCRITNDHGKVRVSTGVNVGICHTGKMRRRCGPIDAIAIAVGCLGDLSRNGWIFSEGIFSDWAVRLKLWNMIC